MSNHSYRALVYAALMVGLAWFNATQVFGHWWPWLMFGAAAIVFLLLAIPPELEDTTTIASPPWRAGGYSCRLVTDEGMLASEWHEAELENAESLGDGRVLEVVRAVCLPYRSGRIASIEVMLAGQRLGDQYRLDDPIDVVVGQPFILTGRIEHDPSPVSR